MAVLYTTRAGESQARRRRSIAGLHDLLFVRHPLASVSAAIAAYALVVLGCGEALAVSANYFVLLPIIAFALAGGMPGGLAAGALGLPANLLLFALLGHPEFSPASKPIAEVFGLVVGASLGYLSDYYRELVGEIEKRGRTEEALRKTLREKELLLQELNHRVKNNLNVIKSLVQLQRSRSPDPAFVAAADELVNRVLAISLVHDKLYEGGSRIEDPSEYLRSIAANVASAFAAPPVSVEVDLGGSVLPPDDAVSLGLVVNEALTNALKHGGSAGGLALRLRAEPGEFRLSVRDEGPGLAPGNQGGEGLGMRIIGALAGQLGGSVSLAPASPGPGSVLELRWPRAAASG